MTRRNVIVILLVASISSLKVGASEDGEERAVPNKLQTSINKSEIVAEALKAQEGNVDKTGVDDRSIYDSIKQGRTEDFGIPDLHKYMQNRILTDIAQRGPIHKGVSHVGLREPQNQEQPSENQKPDNSNKYTTAPNDRPKYRPKDLLGPYQQTSNNSQNQKLPPNKICLYFLSLIVLSKYYLS